MVVPKLRAREFYGAEGENGVFFEVMAVLAYRDLPPTVRETAPAGSEAEPWYHSVFWEEQNGKNGAGRGSEHGKKSQELNKYVFEAGRDVRKMDKGTYDRLREAARCVFCDCYHPQRAVTDDVIVVCHWEQLKARQLFINGMAGAFVTGVQYEDAQSQPTVISQQDFVTFPEAADGFSFVSRTMVAFNLPQKITLACRRVMAGTSKEYSGRERIENVTKQEWDMFCNRAKVKPKQKRIDADKGTSFSNDFISYDLFEDAFVDLVAFTTKRRLNKITSVTSVFWNVTFPNAKLANAPSRILPPREGNLLKVITPDISAACVPHKEGKPYRKKQKTSKKVKQHVTGDESDDDADGEAEETENPEFVGFRKPGVRI